MVELFTESADGVEGFKAPKSITQHIAPYYMGAVVPMYLNTALLILLVVLVAIGLYLLGRRKA